MTALDQFRYYFKLWGFDTREQYNADDVKQWITFIVSKDGQVRGCFLFNVDGSQI